ncbi:unnamed protein product [Bubo scandiacus]
MAASNGNKYIVDDSIEVGKEKEMLTSGDMILSVIPRPRSTACDLGGKSGDWKARMLNLIHSPASVTRRVRDGASQPHATLLSRGACVPDICRKLLPPGSCSGSPMSAIDGFQADLLYLAHEILEQERDSELSRASSNVLLAGA